MTQITDLPEASAFVADDLVWVRDASQNTDKRLKQSTLVPAISDNSASADTIARRDGSGRLLASDASSGNQLVNVSQDVTWTGQHDFNSMPQVGGDPVVESGSNSDGEWTRWADGTQMTRSTYDLGSAIARGNGTIGNWYRTDPISGSYPVAFSEEPIAFGSVNRSGTADSIIYNLPVFGSGSGGGATGFDKFFVARISDDGFDRIMPGCQVIAWGSWK